MVWYRRNTTSAVSFVALILHIVATAIVFAWVFTVGWLVSFLLSYLDSIHKFPANMYRLSMRLELWLFYIDCILSAVILAGSAFKFVRDIVEDKQ